MDYQLVFDVVRDARPSIHLWWLVPLGFLAIALGVFLLRRGLAGWTVGQRLTIFAWVLLAVGFTWYPLAEIQGRFRRYASALSTGRAEVVEGVVADYSQPQYRKMVHDRFRVGDTYFEYTDRVDNGAFHQTAAAGGPIRPGLHVRITHYQGVILRLEIQESPTKDTDITPALQKMAPPATTELACSSRWGNDRPE